MCMHRSLGSGLIAHRHVDTYVVSLLPSMETKHLVHTDVLLSSLK